MFIVQRSGFFGESCESVPLLVAEARRGAGAGGQILTFLTCMCLAT